MPTSIFDSSILWQRAAESAFKYKESRSPSELTLNVIHSPNFTTSNFSTKMESTLRYSLTYWQGLSPKSNVINFVEADESDLTWVMQELSSLGSANYDSFLFKDGKWTNPAAEESLASSSGIPNFFLLAGSRSNVGSNAGLLTQSYHNATHGIMFLNEGNVYLTNQPSCWFSEGHPSFYGFSLSMGNENISMSQVRANQFQHTLALGFVPPNNQADWLTFLKSNESRLNAGCFKYAIGYSIGTATVERLILDFGPQKVNDWIVAQAAVAGEWKSTFQSTFGLSVDDWYVKSAIPYLQATFNADNFEAKG